MQEKEFEEKIKILCKGKLVAEGTMQEVIGDKSLESTFLEIENA